jgi:hypothetical protein
MLRSASPILLLVALAAAENITAYVHMSKPSILEDVSLYSGSVVNVEEDRSTIVMVGSAVGLDSEKASRDSYYDLWFNKQSTRFTFSGSTAFEYKSAWANGMYVNINRCQQYDGDLAYPVLCTYYLHAAWLETLCTALEEDKNLVPDQITRTTVDDVGSTWTISGPDARWTEECVAGSDYIGDGGSGVDNRLFKWYPVLITAGGEKLAAQTGATPTPTDAPKTESPTTESSRSASSGNEGPSYTVTSESHSQSTGTGVPQSITGAGNATLIGTGTPPVQTTSAGFRNTPMMGFLMGVLMAFLFIL